MAKVTIDKVKNVFLAEINPPPFGNQIRKVEIDGLPFLWYLEENWFNRYDFLL